MSYVRGRVVERIDWDEDLWTLRIEAAAEPHEPGQFLNFGLEIEGKIVRRSYSLASPPGAPLELYLVIVEGGALSPLLYRLQPGDAVEVDPKPRGYFTLEYVPKAADLWLVSTGTGLAPYLAMLRAGTPFERFERVVLVHGVREEKHLGYRAEIEALAAARPALTYLPVVSRECAEGCLQGRITTALVEGALERAAGIAITAERSHVMLCGNPGMIEEMMRLLGERDLRRHRKRAPGHITTEKYW